MDNNLLSFVDFLQNGHQSLQVMTEIQGVFGLPTEINQLEESNPNVFVYKIEIMKNKHVESNLQARKLKVSEIKEKEDIQKNKNKGKKENVQQTMQQTQINNEEQEQERILQEQAEQQLEIKIANEKDSVKKQQLIFENPYLSSNIQFFDYENIQNLDEKEIPDIENKILDIKGVKLSFTREIQGSADDIAKLKKAKPKGFNNSDFNPLRCKGWIDLSGLSKPGCNSITERVYLKQDESEQEQTIYDLSKTYVLLKLSLNIPLLQEIQELSPKSNELYDQSLLQSSKSPSTSQLIDNYNVVLTNVIDNLNKEYYNMFGKDRQKQDKVKTSLHQTVTLQKQQEILKRKDMFINEIFQNHKYDNLVNKMRKIILSILVDKFSKQLSVNGMDQQQKATMVSQVYVFLVEQMRSSLNHYIKANNELIHEDIVIQQDLIYKETKKTSLYLAKEPTSDRYFRLAKEFEMLNDFQNANINYINMIKTNTKNDKFYEQYARFLIKNAKFALAEMSIRQAIDLNPGNGEYKKMLLVLLINRERYMDSILMLEGMLKGNKLNMLYNLLCCFIYQQMQDTGKQNKHWQVVQRLVMRQNNMLPPKQPPKYNISPFNLPNIKNRLFQQEEFKKLPDLLGEQSDQCWMEMIDFFADYHLYSLVQKSIDLIKDNESFKYHYYTCLIHQNNKQYNQSIQVADIILEDKPNADVIRIKALSCFYSQKYFNFEEIFQEEMKLRKKNSFGQYLRLGFVYLLRKSWNEGKEVFLECIKQQENSPISWLGLGISCLWLEDFRLAEEALCTANIYDPFNSDIWGYLCYLYLLDNRTIQAQLAFEKTIQFNCTNNILLEQLSDKWYSITKYHNTVLSLKQIISTHSKIKSGEQQEGIFTLVISLGEVYEKLGNSYKMLQNFDKARESYELAFNLLEGNNQKLNVSKQIQKLTSSVNNNNKNNNNNNIKRKNSSNSVESEL